MASLDPNSSAIARVSSSGSAAVRWSSTILDRLAVIRFYGTYKPEEVQPLINEEISTINLALRALYAELNQYSPSSRLPPEIVSYIFSILSEGDHPHRVKGSPCNGLVRDTFGWITATHVCRRWRHIALETPILWRHVRLSLGVVWAEEIAKRAQSQPLHVTLDLAGRSTDRSIAAVCNFMATYLPRIQSLYLEDSSRFVQQVVKCLKHPMPLLESFEIITMPRETGWSFPNELFIGTNTPRLHRLVMAGCQSFNLAPPILRQLICLAIDGELEDHQHLRRALAALGEMPSLERLTMRHCYDRDTLWDPPTFIAPLSPTLSSLILSGHFVHTMSLLRQLRIPPTTRLALTCHSKGHAHAYPALFECLAESTYPMRSPFSHVIFSTQAKTVAMDAWRTPNRANSPECGAQRQDGPPPDLHLSFTWMYSRRGDHAPLMKAILEDVLSVEHLEDLQLHGVESSLARQTWREHYGRARALRSLHIQEHNVQTLCEALTADDQSPVPFLPRLAELQVKRFQDSLIQPLHDAFKVRNADDFHLQRLVLESTSDGDHYEKKLSQLRAVIPNVICFGVDYE
ncbi:hypothetical protein BV25DRAFT_1922512 [Artomyces pyxidatus]|uniref:Uncharacterized protein n=1 Tax=Artomyces pyxidatus TaxID=48021 RepID=A0ACB8SED7_9AGAM|nr:hypothetical protein BV25DRAFT_1922512 [Artomyces pyxidatus]